MLSNKPGRLFVVDDFKKVVCVIIRPIIAVHCAVEAMMLLCYASVWRWRRKAAGSRRSWLERSRVPGAALPMTDGSKARLRFSLSVRDERALHGCERALVADFEPERLLLLGWAGCFIVALWSPRLATPALVVLQILRISDARSAWPSVAKR